MDQLLHNFINQESNYDDDSSYRECLRNMFMMIELTPNTDIDHITNDENNYDEESMSKAMDIIYEKTRNDKLFQYLYQHGAAKMFSMDQEIGLAVLCSYDYFHLFHMCLRDFFKNAKAFHEKSESYMCLTNKLI